MRTFAALGVRVRLCKLFSSLLTASAAAGIFCSFFRLKLQYRVFCQKMKIKTLYLYGEFAFVYELFYNLQN